MSIEELEADCRAYIKRNGKERAAVTIVLPEGWKPPRGFPRRELLCVNSAGQRVCRVNAWRLLRFLTKEKVKVG